MLPFRSRRARETAEALAAAQQALDNLAQSTAALNEAGRRAGEALSGMTGVTARAAAALEQIKERDGAADAAGGEPEPPPEQRAT